MADDVLTPVVKLSAEQVTKLKGGTQAILEAEKSLKILKKMGMDTKELDDKLIWAKEVQDTLLKEFSG